MLIALAYVSSNVLRGIHRSCINLLANHIRLLIPWPFVMGPQILKKFYSCTMLTGCITAWYGNCSASDHKALQRVRPSTSLGPSFLPSRTSILGGIRGRSIKSLKTPVTLVIDSLLPHGKRYRSTKSRTKRLLNGFYPQAIRLLNS